MLEYIILGFLMSQERSGYDLKQMMINSTSNFFDASFGSIYPALKRLEDKQFVIFKESAENNKYRKIYQITENGKDVFIKWLSEPIKFEKARQDHLVKIYFYEFLPKKEAIANLKSLIELVKEVEQNLIHQKEAVAQKHDIYQYYYRYSAMLYGIDFYHFVINWCTNLVINLESDPRTERSEHHINE